MERDDAAGRPSDARGTRSLPAAAYARAEQFLPWHIGGSLLGMTVDPHWLDGGERFWYHARTRRGGTFVVVDSHRGTREPAFDHARLAASLSRAAGTPYEAGSLPFDRIEFVRGGAAIQFDVGAVRWVYDLDGGTCERLDRRADRTGTTSPDGRWTVFVDDHNLRIRSTETGDVRALTADGRPEHDYGTPLASPLEAAGIPAPEAPPAPTVLWSPDSRRILSYRLDRRAAGTYHLVQSVPRNGSRRPVLHSYAYPLPGDDRVPTADLLVVDVERGTSRAVRGEPVPLLYYGSPLRPDWIWWSPDGARIYAVTRGRGFQSYRLSAIDPESGESRVLVEEHGETAIEPHPSHSGGAPIVRVLDGGAQVLWYSTRDGWGHLYLYDGSTGALRRQLTTGAWMVTDVVHVDEAGRQVCFTAMGREPGRDPYFNHLYRVGLDGGQPVVLTPEDATHQVSFAPSGACFVDSYSRVDAPPVAVLRAPDGAVLCELARGDADRLRELGWTPPERFCVKARDGTTDIYGILIRPSHFQAGSIDRLPILDSIYAGPQTNQAPTSFGGYSSTTAVPNKFRDLWHAHALAELGFAVVMIDGLGMPYRSKAFGDRSYRDLGDGGIADHVAAIRQLAARYPYLDVTRVGIYGHSAGGYASTRAMLTFPEFYTVAVSSAGNHDHRLDKASWVERYMGLPVGAHYHDQSNVTLAHRLAGKLLLMHGEMDENVHPASTLQVVDALIAANKDFDLLLLPNRPHGCTSDPYFVRRRWDYFVRHLLGVDPPAGYAIAPDGGTARP